MSDFSLITFCGDHREAINLKNFLKRSISWIKALFMKPKLEDGIKKVELSDDMNIYIIRIPYHMNEAHRHIRRLNKFILKFVMGNNIRYCFLPEKVSDNFQLNGCIKCAFTGELLYKSLLVNILEEIYTSKGLEIRELDIGIIDGNNSSEFYEIVRMLAPFVKFITAVTSRKDSVEEEMNKIYEDTGLCVRVTDGYKNCLKNLDLIINLGSLADVIANAKPDDDAVILNYSGEDISRISCSNTIINGIIINIPVSILSKIDRQVFEYYNYLCLTEAILLFKTGMEDIITDGVIRSTTAKTLSSAFKNSGYAIREFIGRRNPIKVKDIKI